MSSPFTAPAMLNEVHPVYGALGVIMSGVASFALQATALPQTSPWLVPVVSAGFGAGSAWMAVRAASRAAMNKAQSAHTRIDEEKKDRQREMDLLRLDIKDTVKSHTDIILAAMDKSPSPRKPGARTRAGE